MSTSQVLLRLPRNNGKNILFTNTVDKNTRKLQWVLNETIEEILVYEIWKKNFLQVSFSTQTCIRYTGYSLLLLHSLVASFLFSLEALK